MAAASPDVQSMIVETFKKFDANGDGRISRDELKRVLSAISQENFSDDAVDALLKASDTNQDGFIQYEEFVAWVTQDMKEFKPLDKRGDFIFDYRKLLPTRLNVDVKRRYNLDSAEIGAGGFGKVFVARDREFGERMVAVKRVQKPTARNDIADVQKEIEVMKELDHPNICKLLATFEEGRVLYFIMELCEGGEVFDRIIENGFITERTTASIVGQVASALAYAHQRQIAHRDIKPENVVFCTKDPNDNRVKVIDWGLATKIDDTMVKAVGSMTYAAPEVIASQDRKVYTEACDVWSKGVLTYVMLCGKPPFWGTREQHYRAARNERYPFSDPPWDTMNPQAKDFVRGCLKANPSERLPISECVKHPWVVSAATEGSTEHRSAVIGNLKCFAAQTTFSRMCITAVARQLDHKKLKDIHQVFRSMDKDGNGVLSPKEVADGLKEITGESYDEAQFKELFENLDMDGSATIDYTEFCAAGLGQQSSTQDDVIWAAFKTFDVDNTGYINADTLKRILDSADVQDCWSADVCAEVGREIVSKFDKDGDGRITFEDWKNMMQQCWDNKKSIANTSSQQSRASVSAYQLLAEVNQLSLNA